MKKKIRDKISATTKLTHWTKTKSQKEIDEIQSRRVAKMVGKHWKLQRDDLKIQAMRKYSTENGWDFNVWSEENINIK